MQILSHRGLWWPDPAAQNTRQAFESAAVGGYGLELDVRLQTYDRKEHLAIAHDPLPPQSFRFLHTQDILSALHTAPLLAWNLKDSSVLPLLASFLSSEGLRDKSVIFDWEFLVPSMFTPAQGDAWKTLPLLVRASDKPSEYSGESLENALYTQYAVGVWLDTFEKDWVTQETIVQVHAVGKSAYVVSPEIHGRKLDLALWEQWREADGVCTDFPVLFSTFYSKMPAVFPFEPWWSD